MLENVPSRYAGNLVGGVTSSYSGDITITPMPALFKDDGTSEVLTEVGVIISSNKQEDYDNGIGAEEFELENGVENADGSGTYDIVKRGIANNSNTVVPTGNVAWQTNHQDGAPVIIDPTYKLRALDAAFIAGSANGAGEAGVAISLNQPVSLHTDNKLYPYNKTNYPVLVGVAQATVASGESLTYTNLRGTHTTFTGLTPNALIFAEDGAVTETGTDDAEFLGKAISASVALLSISSQDLAEATQEEAEAGTEQGVYSSPRRVFQAINAFFTNAAEFLSSVFVIKDKDVTTGDITAFADAGSGSVMVTSAAHGLTTTESVAISGTTNYDGNYEVTVVDEDTFTIVATWVSDDATGTWTLLNRSVAFDVSGITDGERRTITVPDADIDLSSILGHAVIAGVDITAGQAISAFDGSAAKQQLSSGSVVATLNNSSFGFDLDIDGWCDTLTTIVLKLSCGTAGTHVLVEIFESDRTTRLGGGTTGSIPTSGSNDVLATVNADTSGQSSIYIKITNPSAVNITVAGAGIPYHITTFASTATNCLTDARNTDLTKFIGIAQNAAVEGETVYLKQGGTDENQVGMTVGGAVYLSNTPGALSNSAGTNNIIVGRAISATDVVIFHTPA